VTPSFHLYLPQMRMTHAAIVERALAAEDVGFEGIAFMDHLAPPLTFEHGMWDAMTTAAWVLARTTTLTVGHLVLLDALRHPAVLAREVTSLDHASGGRFELGIGWGSVPSELEIFGVGTAAAAERISRLTESLEILRALWSGEVVDYQGEHFTLAGAQQQPVPTRRIPITIGGIGPRTLKLVRAHADWWNVPVHQLDQRSRVQDQVGGARVSVQSMVALVPSDDDRENVTAVVERRFGATGIRPNLVIGTCLLYNI
jgi:alkanesulfonate monooxygenase SsuD/methylene tetrahydromethanopterin reductase-like flavin-dependent oxidoreductase (luciferase family)